jgi:hypothetical protein
VGVPENGFIITPRRSFDHPFWNEERVFSKWEAWQDLIQRAQYKNGNELKNWENVKLKRGQLLTSIKGLADSWGRSRTWVRNLLSVLTQWDTIQIEKRHRFIIITICNYDKYQSLDSYIGQQKDRNKTSYKHNKDIIRTHTKKEKKEKKAIVRDLFKFWNSLMVNVHEEMSEKMEALLDTHLQEHTPDDIKRVMENYKRILEHPGFVLTHRWNLDEFLSRAFAKFTDTSRPYHRYFNSKHWTEGDMERWRITEQRAHEAPSIHQDDEIYEMESIDEIRRLLSEAPFNQEKPP